MPNTVSVDSKQKKNDSSSSNDEDNGNNNNDGMNKSAGMMNDSQYNRDDNDNDNDINKAKDDEMQENVESPMPSSQKQNGKSNKKSKRRKRQDSEILLEPYRERPFKGKGASMRSTIDSCWLHWRDEMIEEANNGFVDAQMDYASYLWNGCPFQKIEVDRRAGFRWMSRAASCSSHELYAKGGCGATNCHKCSAENYVRKMNRFFAEEEIKEKTTPTYLLMHNLPLCFRICSFLDAQSLLALSQTNALWNSKLQDPQPWAHINISQLLQSKSPIRRSQLFSFPLQCKVCSGDIQEHDDRYDAVDLSELLKKHFFICCSCYKDLENDYSLSTLDYAFQQLNRWDAKFEVEKQEELEAHMILKLKLPVIESELWSLIRRDLGSSLKRLLQRWRG
jgi:hypothetical protein